VPAELETIVLKALEKNPADRYGTAQELADDLRRFLEDRPIRARRPTLWQRLRKWGRRHQGVVGTAVAALVLAVVLLALSTAWVWKENQARNKAYQKALEAVERMLTRVADERVAAIPQMQGVRQRLLEDAVTLYSDLIDLNRDDARAYHERGWVYFLLARYDQAHADYEKAVALEPDNADHHGTLATFFDKCPDPAFRDGPRSLHHARRMVELRPTDAEAYGILGQVYLSAGQWKAGKAELRKGAELARGTALEHKLLAVVELWDSNWREAIAHLRQVRDLPPPDLFVYYYLAEAHLNLGENADALAAAERGVELARRPSDDPAGPSPLRASWRGIQSVLPTSLGLASLYVQRGNIYLRQKEYEAAVADYDSSLKVYASHLLVFWPYKERALAHFRLGHYEQALADVARAIEIRPDDHIFYRRYGGHPCISSELVASCPDEKFRAGMLALAGKAIERSRGKGREYFARGSLYAALKQYDNARADFEKAVELGATDAGVLNSVAWALATFPAAEFRDPKRAVALATKAVELSPRSWHIWNTLGVAHYRAGAWRAAVVALEKVIEIPPSKGGDSNDWFFLAMAHWQLGDKAEARRWYDKAVPWMEKNMPQDDEVHDELRRFRAEAADLLGVKDSPPRNGKEVSPR
jgi:tetratricopeptide (TPR) repeat protein